MDKNKVGYGNPPKHTQFKKGLSGNPGGRPKREKGLANLVARELDTRITIQENGQKKTVTKREALVKKIVNGALGSDQKSISQLLKLLQDYVVETPTNYQQGGVLVIPPAVSTEEWEMRSLARKLLADKKKRTVE